MAEVDPKSNPDGRESSHAASSKPSKRYSDRRRENQARNESNSNEAEIKNDAGATEETKDQMSKDLSNMLHLEKDRSVEVASFKTEYKNKKDRASDRNLRRGENEMENKDKREDLDIDKRKKKVSRLQISLFSCSLRHYIRYNLKCVSLSLWDFILLLQERPALQIYKPGMRRHSSQTNPQGNSSRNDEEEKFKTSETKSMESPDEGSYKQERYSNKQKDRSNRGYRNDQGNENSGYKRQDKYERHQKSKGSDNLEHRGADQGKKEHGYSSRVDDRIKKTDFKPDYKQNHKERQADTRNDDAQHRSAKYEGRQYGGKDKKDGGRGFHHQSLETKQSAHIEGETISSKEVSNDNQISNRFESGTPSAIEDEAPKGRSGKSYSSKRRERQQQRNEQ